MRQEVEHLVQVLENSNEDSIWIKLKKEKFGGKNDIYIGTYYVNPEGKKNKKVDYIMGLRMTSWSLISQT